MCRASIFSCIGTMISNFSIIYTFREFFLRFIFHKCNNILHPDVTLVLLLLTVTFFLFQNKLYFLRALLKIHKTFLYSLFHHIKYVCFLCDQMPKFFTLNIRKEYATQFLLLKNFLDMHMHLSF